MKQEEAQENQRHGISQEGSRQGTQVDRRVFCRDITAREEKAGVERIQDFFGYQGCNLTISRLSKNSLNNITTVDDKIYWRIKSDDRCFTFVSSSDVNLQFRFSIRQPTHRFWREQNQGSRCIERLVA